MKPTYFDFTVKDLDIAKSFFEHVFDWRLEKFPGMPHEYYRIQAGVEDEPGIDESCRRYPKLQRMSQSNKFYC